MNQILVVLPVADRHKKKLERAADSCCFHYVPLETVTAAQVRAADIIVGNVPPQYIEQSARLKMLQLSSAGADPYIKPGILHSETKLVNATGAYGKAVGEHVFAMLLALQKKLHVYRDDQAKGFWNDYGTVTSITDATVLIIGLGDIGLHFARMAKALGAYVIGIKRRSGTCPKQVDELFLTADLPSVLPRADVVLSVLPDTPDTRGIYNQTFFQGMKRNGIFLNAGRGTAVDQDALLSALRNRELMAAGLDVTTPEPLPADHPLWQEPQVLITPHISGQYHLPETFDRIIEIAAANLEAYFSHQPLKNVIDFETGYCR